MSSGWFNYSSTTIHKFPAVLLGGLAPTLPILSLYTTVIDQAIYSPLSLSPEVEDDDDDTPLVP